MTMGLARDSVMRCAISLTSSELRTDFRMTTNSSPPMRITMSSLAQRGAQPLRNRLEQLIPGLVTARIIDVLEPVEIQEQHRQNLVALRGHPQRLRQMRRQEQADWAGP